MQQKLADVERKGGSLCVRLKEGSAFDPYIYEQIRMDETCLPPLQERKGVIRYETAGLTSLSYFLAHYHFEQEEAYRFIIQLLEHLLKANRTKPVLLDVRYVFLPPQGTFFRFVALPLNVEHWHLQKQESLTFIEYLASHVQTSKAYEIVGFLMRVIHGDEFSLPNVLQGLHALRQLYEKKPGFWERRRKRREEEGFHARVKVLEETYREEEKVPALQEPGGSYAVTTLLQAPARQDFLQEGEEIYLLYDEEMVIGRGEECAIRVDSEQVSRQHARLRRADDRWYVRDLRSRNGSWLNDKRLQREMRLKEGMQLKIADHVFVFHEHGKR